MNAKYLVIDTETSGLFDFSKPADADGQPRMAALAMIWLDEELKAELEVEMLIKPDGWEMPEEASAINGLTMEKLASGIPVVDALNQYVGAVKAGVIVVAFNAQYDLKVLRGELRRAKMPDLFESTPNICTMRGSSDICKLPGKRGFKFPKLAEACAHFEIKNDGPHSALGDARACAEILRKLVALNACPKPQVHFAKDKP